MQVLKRQPADSTVKLLNSASCQFIITVKPFLAANDLATAYVQPRNYTKRPRIMPKLTVPRPYHASPPCCRETMISTLPILNNDLYIADPDVDSGLVRYMAKGGRNKGLAMEIPTHENFFKAIEGVAVSHHNKTGKWLRLWDLIDCLYHHNRSIQEQIKVPI